MSFVVVIVVALVVAAVAAAIMHEFTCTVNIILPLHQGLNVLCV